MVNEAALAAFEARVDKSRGPEHCWLWTGTSWVTSKRSGERYGGVYAAGKHWMAHRLSHELFVGPIPEGLVVDHLCRNTLCVNPLHLEAVTQRENALRGVGIMALNARKTHCANGHPLSVIPYDKRGARGCMGCLNARRRERHQRNVEASRSSTAGESVCRSGHVMPAGSRDANGRVLRRCRECGRISAAACRNRKQLRGV